MRDIFVVGTSGLAKEMAQLIRQIDSEERRWRFGGYIAESSSEIGKRLPWGTVVGDDRWLLGRAGTADVVIGVGNPGVRRQIACAYQKRKDFQFPNLIHPTAMIDSECVRLGVGNVVAMGVAFTCEIEAGDFNLFNLNVTVGHDCRVGSYNVVNPGANISGNVTIGDEVLVGTGSQILEGTQITSKAVVGAGAVVVRDITEQGIWMGVPAKPKVRS